MGEILFTYDTHNVRSQAIREVRFQDRFRRKAPMRANQMVIVSVEASCALIGRNREVCSLTGPMKYQCQERRSEMIGQELSRSLWNISDQGRSEINMNELIT